MPRVAHAGRPRHGKGSKPRRATEVQPGLGFPPSLLCAPLSESLPGSCPSRSLMPLHPASSGSALVTLAPDCSQLCGLSGALGAVEQQLWMPLGAGSIPKFDNPTKHLPG